MPSWADLGSPGSRARCFRSCSGSVTARDSVAPRDIGAPDGAFRFLLQRRRPGVFGLRGCIPGPHIPLSTLRRRPRERLRMTQGRCRSLLHIRMTLSFTTPRRFNRRTRRKAMSKMTLKTEGDTHVIVTRRFTAPPEAVYRAHTDPKLIQKWLLGPEGWTMPVCINEAKPGGKFRYEWTNGKGGGFHITGEYVELQPYKRIVHVERMHLPDPTPDNHIETRFEADGAGTLMTMRMTLPDGKTRAAMLATGMERGMEASYVRLEGML